jgi:hypothetical protein
MGIWGGEQLNVCTGPVNVVFQGKGFGTALFM